MAIQIPLAAISYRGNNCLPLPLPHIPPPAREGGQRSFACCSLRTNSGNADFLARLPQNSKQDTFRPLIDFPPDVWCNHFASLSIDNSELESNSGKVESLKEIVRDSLIASKSDDPLEKVNLINLLYRLGVSYHFENEIEKQLNHLFEISNELINEHDYNLSTVALIFQVFGQHGYKIPCDVFNKFTDKNGKFKSSLARDVKGILRLYEACQWGIQGEGILDEANSLTMDQLCSLAKQSSPHLQQYILNALNRPYHRGVPRVEHRQFISFYEQEESRNDTLLNLAKLDFNRLQLLHQQELKVLIGWWKELNSSSMINIRDRIAEVFFWSVGHYFEPQYARARKILTQLIQLLAALADTYDAYGAYEELRCLANAILRWDRSALDQLPTDPLKALYKAILDTHEEAEREVSNEGRSFAISYTKEETQKTLKTYIVQARWTVEDHLPTLDEYLDIASYSSATILVLAQAFVGMEEAGIETFKWLARGDGKTLDAITTIGPFYNDIVTNEDEEKRGLVDCGLNCSMKEFGVSKEEAIEEFKRRLPKAWKELNEDWLMRPTIVPRKILLRAFNMARVADLTYKDADGFTYSAKVLKGYIHNLFLEPIPISYN
ncbi:hypothetical protein SLA2020_296390 [Shorea laevis]